LVLVSVAATGILFLRPDFWLAARWVLLGLLALQLLMGRERLGSVNVPVVMAGMLYIAWCALTSAWSEVPDLTYSKVAALALTSFATLCGGYQWGMRRNQPSLTFLTPYAAVGFLAAILGGGDESFWAENMQLYAGSTVNPNFLGLLMATATPVLIWELYRRWEVKLHRLVLLGILGFFVAVLYATVSRSAYVVFVAIATGFVMAYRVRRPLLTALVVVWLALIVVAVAPEAGDSWIRRNIYKQTNAELGLFVKREAVWSASFDAAKVGGWLGAGYGVSVGSDESEISSAVSTAEYGREKGNSQLAIVEEIGIVGLLLYVLVMIALFRALRAGFKAAEGEMRIVIGLVMGTLMGLQLHSVLEAWWVSPGSPEFVFFWVTAGAGLGMARLARISARARHVAVPRLPAVSRV
jgi:O-antigen ligase